MEKYKKFLLKLSPALRKRLILAIEKIADGQVSGLDIKKLHNEIPVYRCRVGKVRILFEKAEDGNRILAIKFRGDVY
ncbi:type II toxin-antitoxin system RelE/ParE family toxin [Candidatus Peregrinibacteria bacterium]|jgi:mRNA-degrading endonuclease RelE of RelBE toxin-antitoxin system|nr:type II toxin-antitoxin system RelE/ParE family toxin [Candidatus Peregrinibacteria bacterium]MBT4147732.1 type II toxin-antitoxin system RelE/ParE family toxin [Candidatus Peregrinibacteria bacterium]MBT4366206.1 type II toxin-antitoxin system RelE/ParE family toxin [Candidatus Peregrinibacteria bacterium]MBT4455723.1 type II toxin-antitoxin system RelE/ParE family toxin [Candidatus Peregrinibacteria bacterium]